MTFLLQVSILNMFSMENPAHSAAFPWRGANALSGVIQMFNAVDAMRLHFKDYTRVHGIITEGGTAHNTITDRAVCLFNIRALEFSYLEEVIKMIENCAKGASNVYWNNSRNQSEGRNYQRCPQ